MKLVLNCALMERDRTFRLTYWTLVSQSIIIIFPCFLILKRHCFHFHSKHQTIIHNNLRSNQCQNILYVLSMIYVRQKNNAYVCIISVFSRNRTVIMRWRVTWENWINLSTFDILDCFIWTVLTITTFPRKQLPVYILIGA